MEALAATVPLALTALTVLGRPSLEARATSRPGEWPNDAGGTHATNAGRSRVIERDGGSAAAPMGCVYNGRQYEAVAAGGAANYGLVAFRVSMGAVQSRRTDVSGV